jgi:hypothetical protein
VRLQSGQQDSRTILPVLHSLHSPGSQPDRISNHSVDMFCCIRPPAVLEQTESLDNSSKMIVAKEKPSKAADRVAVIMYVHTHLVMLSAPPAASPSNISSSSAALSLRPCLNTAPMLTSLSAHLLLPAGSVTRPAMMDQKLPMLSRTRPTCQPQTRPHC